MPAIRGTRRTLLSGNETGALLTQQRTDGSLYILDMQEPTGDVSLAWNIAVPLGRELYSTPNAASDPAGNEADATTGWASIDSTLTSDSSVKAAGSYSIKMVSTGVAGRVYQDLTVTYGLAVGKSYRLRFWWRHTGVAVGDGDITAWFGLNNGGGVQSLGTKTKTDLVFTEVVVDFVHSTNSRFFVFRENNAEDDGGVYIDNVSIKQTNIAASSEFPGAEELVDGDMEAIGTAAWTASNSTLSKQTASPYQGTRLLRVTATAQAGAQFPSAQQTVLTPGKRYHVAGVARSDGTEIPRVNQGGTTRWNGTTSTDWQAFNFEFVAAGITGRIEFVFHITDPGGTEYTEWDDVSVREANPLNGDDTGTTPVAGGPRIQVMQSFDGTTSFMQPNPPSVAELNSIFDPTQGTIIIAARVANAGVWTDGANRYMVSLVIDAGNQVSLRKHSDNNKMRLNYTAGGVGKFIDVTTSTTGIFTVAITWDVGGDEFKAYFNGVQVGATLNALGTWVGNLFSAQTVIGAFDISPINVWHGDLAYPELYSRALTQPEIAAISRSLGVF